MSDDPAYQRAHSRVRRERGSAKDHPCAGDCGGPAEQWAYQRGSAGEQVSREGWPFSFDPSDYKPMCRYCHRRVDMGSKTPEETVAYLEGQRSKSKIASGFVTRRTCSCGFESHQAGIGIHQKASGHTGWTDVEGEQAS